MENTVLRSIKNVFYILFLYLGALRRGPNRGPDTLGEFVELEALGPQGPCECEFFGSLGSKTHSRPITDQAPRFPKETITQNSFIGVKTIRERVPRTGALEALGSSGS